MLPAKYDLSHYQGDERTITLRARNTDNTYENLNGLVGSGQIRATPESDTVLASFVVTIPDQGVVENRGFIVCYLSPAESAKLTSGSLAYDIQTADELGGQVRTRMYGTFFVIPQVTR